MSDCLFKSTFAVIVSGGIICVLGFYGDLYLYLLGLPYYIAWIIVGIGGLVMTCGSIVLFAHGIHKNFCVQKKSKPLSSERGSTHDPQV
jgi:hypothetical protein